jgi:GcrA cell cycle regulator
MIECVGVSLIELQAGVCRWPLGDVGSDEFRFCGAPSPAIGGPYCQKHHALAYEPADARQRWNRWATKGLHAAA